VSTGKADIAFAEPQVAESFIKNNPGKIKIVQAANPLRVYGNVMMIAQGQDVFKAMLNVALEEQINSGHIDMLIAKYQTLPKSYYPIAKPFSLPR
jgi:ABC-type amino acid transport substrate-binding protein